MSARPDQMVGRFLDRQMMSGQSPKLALRPGQMSAHQWWDLHVLKTNIRRVEEQQRGTQRLDQSLSPRPVSPRHHASDRWFPGYAPSRPRPLKPPTPPQVIEVAPAPANEPEIDQPKRRGHGELPKGVTQREVQLASNMIRDKLIDKHNSLHAGFRSLDKDGSGTVTTDEVQKALETYNLVQIRPDVVQVLFELVDADATGEFNYKEFARVMCADDIFRMEAVKQYDRGKYVDDQKAAEAAELARKVAEAARMGMTLEEHTAYWDSVPKSAFGNMTSADMAQVIR